MRFQKLFFLLFVIVILTITFPVGIVNADYKTEMQTQLGAAAGKQGADFGAPRDPRLVVAYVIQILLGMLGIAFVIYTVYAGVLILTSGGEEEKIKKGKRILRNGVLGVIIILSAYSLTLLVYRIATGDVEHTGDYFEVEQDYSQWGVQDPLNQPTTPFTPW